MTSSVSSYQSTATFTPNFRECERTSQISTSYGDASSYDSERLRLVFDETHQTENNKSKSCCQCFQSIFGRSKA